MSTDPNRRPIASREVPAAKRFATWLADTGVSPNAISGSSIVFGCLAGAALAATSQLGWTGARVAWVTAALMMQLRLLANMFDGMVAIESGKSSAVGELYNEAPDRVSDAAILIGAGFAAGGSIHLGYISALLAVSVAYVRALGAAAGAGQVFLGPMAKPQRMFIMTIAALYCGLSPRTWQIAHADTGWSTMGFALLFIAAGCTITLLRRLTRIGHILRSRA